ncbi:MAG: alpha-galactosidase [Saccharofermentanales bacterium]
MIECNDQIFHLSTEATSYFFRITQHGHPENLYYGDRIGYESIGPLAMKHTIQTGSSVMYAEEDPDYCLDTLTLEYSGIGKGDYRHSPVEIRMPDTTYVCDFTYVSHRIFDGCRKDRELPSSYGEDGGCTTLEIRLADSHGGVCLFMYYTVYPSCNVITRSVVLRNDNERELRIRKLMSMMLDLNCGPLALMTLDGGWIREAHSHTRILRPGLFVNESTTGASSNRHNPGIILHEADAGESHGRAYGFNLVYSGNHYEAVELSSSGTVRVMSGINPHCFEWPLAKGESFETPEAVLTYSSGGFNGVSRNFHDFVNSHIVRGNFKGVGRPVLINSWEAFFFKFSRRSLMRLARQSARLGVELFVLDDGWFGKREDDRSGLGDYTVNRRKLPGGLERLGKNLEGIGMDFGLWFEPEMVSEDSDLFRSHPEYAVRIEGRKPSKGRNQLVLDLCNPDVRDYIVGNVRKILDSAPIRYVKWDMNRHLSDMFSSHIPEQGMFFHRYMLGHYEVLSRIFSDRPHLLLETCSSGGNRFDLGMLCFSPQIWTSDNTDPIERLAIQTGLSYFYPQSCIGAHVSLSPHQQTLRSTPLSTRFNVACFGNLGYELDISYLTPAEKREVKEQIRFYKKNRKVLQFGDYYRFDSVSDNHVHLMCVSRDRSSAIAGDFQILAAASSQSDILPLTGLDPDAHYTLRTVPKGLSIKSFGALINHLLPFRLHPDGFILRTVDRLYRMPDCVEEYKATGTALHAGVRLNNQFMGTGYNKNVRMMGDFGSSLYDIAEDSS